MAVETLESPGSASARISQRLLRGGLVGLLLVVLAVTALRLAWYGDDWLITLRTVLNAAHGNGLRFNVDERVAAYTHPLWMLAMLVVGSMTGSWVTSIILLSIALAIGTAAVLLLRARTLTAVVAIGVSLIVCNTVTVWSTGGLEGPLAGLLIVGFAASAQWATTSPVRGVLWGVLLASVYLTRADAVVLVMPLVLYAMWRWRTAGLRLRWPAVGLLIPVGMWTVFSWSYYGSVLPNTYAAKTNIDIPAEELIAQGLFYLKYSVAFDNAVWVPFALAVAAWAMTRSRVAAMLLLGVVAYLIYVVWVGGDFMAGRFLYVPTIVALAAISEASRTLRSTPRMWSAVMLTATAAVVVAGFGNSLAMTGDTDELRPMSRGVVDERAFWISAGSTNLLGAHNPSPTMEGMDPAAIEHAAQNWTRVAPATPRTVVVEYAGIGAKGIRNGPTVHILDTCGLTDRVMALQTFVPVPGPPTAMDPLVLSGPGWRVGHYHRPVPDGYIDAIRWDDPEQVRDPGLRRDVAYLWTRIRP